MMRVFDGRMYRGIPTLDTTDKAKAAVWQALGAVTMRDYGMPAVCDDGNRDVLRQVAEFVRRDDGKTAWGLLLTGPVGTGKTTVVRLVQWLMARLSAACPTATPDDVTLYVRSSREIVASWSSASGEFARLKSVPMLAIDDLGGESLDANSYGNTSQPVVEMIEHRYAQRLVTIITSNMTAKAIATRYGARVGDRLKQMCTVVPCKGRSRR